MPIKWLFLLLAAGTIISAGKAKAQNQPVEETYSQAKLAIWCETIFFVYQDHGADSLGQRLDCNNWEAFRQSLRPNYLQANTFFQSIEKPEIYEGYSSNEAKLTKLVEEIGRKLKSSPARQNNPSRREAVDSLQAELLQLAQSPVLFSGGEGTENEPLLTNGSTQRSNTSGQEAAATEEDEEETGSGWFSWPEFLQWFFIVVLLAATAALWNENRKLKRNVGIRMARRKQEIAGLAQENVRKARPEPQFSNGLSRSEVLQLIRSENSKLQKQLSGNRPKQAENQQKQAERPPETAASVSRQEDVVTAQAQERNGEQASPGIYYDKLPFKGGFHHNQLSAQRHPDSIYSIEVLKRKPDEAEFWVTEDADIQKYAMENGLSFFEEACEYDQVEENPSRVRNLERGKLRKKGHLWQIEKKVKVSFE